MFSDTSEFAYRAAAYLKVTSDADVQVSLVMGKSRVAPIKTVSIPRLELTAALVDAKLARFIQEDSDFHLKVFVAHRVQQI